MATKSYAVLHQLNSSGVVVGSASLIVADSGANATLEAGDLVTMDRLGQHFEFRFDYASGDGFVVTLMSTSSGFPPGQYWFTDTFQQNGTTPTNDGPTYLLCFCAGTQIATPQGEVAVETLSVGDLVLTVDGSARPIRWIGRQTVATAFADPLKVAPVGITAGALGGGLPLRDLRLSSDHALLLDGVLVQAGALVNGVSIVRETALPERLTFYNIELDDHALILAEGCPAETFVDNVARQRFDNYADYVALYGEAARPIAEMDLPRVKAERQLPAGVRGLIAVAQAA